MNSRIKLPSLPGNKAISISTFVFLSGIFMGIFMAVTMEPSEKEAIAEHLLSFLAGDAADVSFIDYAQTAFRKNAVLWLVIFTGGFTVLGAPLSMLPLLYKGAALGLSCTMIIDSMSTDGIKLIMLSVLPQNMLLVPLFISAFRRATDLAMAMEARCYRGGEGRTKMKPLQYKREDHDAYMIFALYLVVMIASRVYL